MERDKPNILILTDWFVPGYKAGGPIQSLNNLVSALQNEVVFSVFTGDRDLMSDSSYTEVEINKWLDFDHHRRLYASKDRLTNLLESELSKPTYDWIYLNSFFSTEFTIKPLIKLRGLGRLDRVILAPRGMLGKGALSVKPFKKRVFIAVFNLMGIGKRVHFLSTDISETRDIQSVLGKKVWITTLANIPIKPIEKAKEHRASAVTRFIYASRISPKKNTLFLLQHMVEIVDKPFKLEIYGTADDPAYYSKCRAVVENDVRFEWHQAVPPLELYRSVKDADFFVLPTRNENFGHAIIEAMAHGTPVIISDQTPWNDLETFGAGWVIPLTDGARWREVLQCAMTLSDADYSRMSQRALEYVRSKFDFDDIRNQYLNLFRAANRPQ